MRGGGSLAPDQKYTLRQRLMRVLRYRLIVPLKRSRHAPEHTARGVMIGVAWAMTPTVGVQMPLVFANWIAARKLFNWDFNLVNALAWTWLSNIFTLPPLYYLFFISGQFMLGRFDDLAGYEVFLKLIDGWQNVSLGNWEATSSWFLATIKGPGAAMIVGCIPWAALSGWLAYIWSLAFVRTYRDRKAASHQNN